MNSRLHGLLYIFSLFVAATAVPVWTGSRCDTTNSGLSAFNGPVQCIASKPIMTVSTAASAIQSSPVITTDGTILVGSTDSRLYFIAGTEVKYTLILPSPVHCSPVLSTDNIAYVGTTGGYLCSIAVNPKYEVNWHRNIEDIIEFLQLTSDGEILLVVTRSATNAGSGAIRAISSYTGADIWVRRDLYVYALPTVYLNDTIAYLACGGAVMGISVDTGETIWRKEMPYNYDAVSSIGVFRNRVFIGVSSGFIYALRATDGDERWPYSTTDNFTLAPAVSPDNETVYFVGRNTLYAFDYYRGLVWRYLFGSVVILTPPSVDSTGMIYIGTNVDRAIFAFRPDGSLFWASPPVCSECSGTPTVVSTLAISAENSLALILSTKNGNVLTYVNDGCVGTNAQTFVIVLFAAIAIIMVLVGFILFFLRPGGCLSKYASENEYIRKCPCYHQDDYELMNVHSKY